MSDLHHPDLIIIGAQKAGTTWLHQCLNAHPEVPSATHQPDVLGEYGAPKKIKKKLGEEIRFVLSLRDPVDRAVSAFFHHYRAGQLSPSDTILSKRAPSGIIDIGRYKRHLIDWLSVFPREQFFATFYDDIQANGDDVASGLYEWLGLDPRGIAIPATRTSAEYSRCFVPDAITVEAPDGATISVSVSDLMYLADLFQEDVEFVKETFERPDLPWGGQLSVNTAVSSGLPGY